MGYRSNQKRWRDQKFVQITWSGLVEFAPSVLVWKWRRGKIVSVILLLTIVYCYGTKGAKCPPCPLWYGIYKCNSPRFSSCVTLRWQPGLREISLFNCRVQMTMIGWKNGVRPIMRDRFQKICTGKCTLYIYSYIYIYVCVIL